MNHHRFHGLEKIQVQLVTIAALAVVYFGVYPSLAPADPRSPVTFLAALGGGSLSHFALLTVVLSAAMAALTTAVRVEGVLVTVLVGLGGAALRSEPFNSLLWYNETRLSWMYGQLLIETFTLVGLAILAGAIIVAVRSAVAAVRPGWLWHDPLREPGQADGALSLAAGGLLDHFRPERKPHGSRKASPLRAADLWKKTLPAFAVYMVVAFALYLLLMRSDDRGQGIFAVAAAFLLAATAAHQFFPSPMGLLLWAGPLVLAAAFYVQGMTTVIDSSPQAWMAVPIYTRVLPIDWMTFGVGGGYLGYWISLRLSEMKHFESLDAE